MTARDALTGLADRGAAIERLGEMLRTAGDCCAGLIDIDFFTNLCARVGEREGDDILRRLAAMLSEASGGLAYRYGDDEFLLLLPCAGRPARLLAADSATDGSPHAFFDALRRRIARAGLVHRAPYEKVPIRLSIGIACGAEGDAPFAVLKAAEIALQSAKKKGRYRVEEIAPRTLQWKSKGRLHTLAGCSLRGDCVEGAACFDAPMAEPYGVEAVGDSLLFVDRSNHKIKRIDKGVVTTLVGTGRSGFGGDGGAAARAMLCKPSGVAVDPHSGRLYLADTGNHRIRVVEQGRITTLAGTGDSGYSGDGGDALSARFNRPGGVAADALGNVYTNDYGNNVIRRIDPSGIVSTVAGCGEYGYSGDGGAAVLARLDRPYGLCVSADGRFLYIADYGNHCIRRVTLASGVIDTLCGTGEPGDTGDGGPGACAKLRSPYWVSLCFDGILLIADAGNHRIRAMNLHSGRMKTVCGDQPGYVDSDDPAAMRLRIPAGMAVQGDSLVIADYGNNALRRYWLRPGDLPD